MTANNLKEPTDSSDDGSKENQTNSVGHTQHDSTIHVNGALNAKTGGQMNGGVVIQSGNRIQAENQTEAEDH